MRRLWQALLGLLLVLGTAGTLAGDLAIGHDASQDLRRSFDVLEDRDGRLTFEDVLAPAVQARFHALRPLGPGPNFGLTHSVYWLRVTLRTARDAPADWLLEIAYPPLDRIEVIAVDATGRRQQHAGGDSRSFASRAVAHRNHVFPLRLAPGQTTTLYLRVQSEGTVSVPARLWQPTALWRHDQAAYAALSLYFGLLLGLMLYNMLLFVSLREPGYVFYVAFVAAMGMSQVALSGLGAQYLWPRSTWWNGVSAPVGLTVTAIFGLLFARSFLASAQRMRTLDRILLAQMAGWGLALAAELALPYTIANWMVTILAPASVITMTVVGVMSIRRGIAGASHFFTAWALLLLGVAILSLHNIGILPSNAVTANALLIGSALEMVLLSFALGDRINVARRFKEQAQARIAAERAMVGALSQAQERLKEVLEEREIILENSLVGIVFLTGAGRLKWANRAMLEILGVDEPVTTLEPFYLSREHYLEVGAEVARTVGRGEVYERELQVRRRDGTLIWILLSGKAVGGDDLAQGTVWVVRNISPRKQLEQQLRATMSEREAILNNAVVGIVLSVYRRHEWVNEKFAQMLGYPKQILIGQSSIYIHPSEQEWERFGEEARAALIATNGYTCERQLRRRNGELFWVEMGGSCVRANDPDSGVIWTFLDITERKRSEAQMREALEQQQALNALRARFVAMTSHEFRTPLAAILSAEEVLRHHGDRLTPQDRAETLDSIAMGVQRMTRMMDRVLLLGRADAQMLAFEPHEVNVPVLCRRLVEEVWAQHPETHCEIAVRAAPGVGTCRCDEKLLRHIFGNLLFNAIKYSPGGGRVRFNVRAEDAELVFEVADQGIGIPPDEIPHLFESFHRASNVGSIQGTGLGLAIVKNAVQVHGGRISVDSALGQGTTFTVRLPLVEVSA
ncbi:MAG TPA: 7TM diverse intracellular signaling domain-containing protein [Ramlibacter sp.]|jgi:PAS domain S-box-containing protein|uniref:sensor histidine kinase n=1 Tax=Ramlibacter sp. TaxID=1917967 RepID=UPI002D539616|nr:7TM diverse intracellular signaling domain-containing protein [Ramlibacter sp.]HZY18165.1 7TM diverse intracellular signaling domain-containing protein [Ramlibacter sp.]